VVDEPNKPGRALDRLDEILQDDVQRLLGEPVGVVGDREIVRHPELRRVAGHNLHVLAAVLILMCSHQALAEASDLWNDLHAYHSLQAVVSLPVDESAHPNSTNVVIGGADSAQCSR
jgi:hypothetical protein